jgi:putative ABC transport system permease protein
MTRVSRWLLERLCRLLPPAIAAAAAGDLEEEWRRHAGEPRIRASLRFVREAAGILCCALRSPRAAGDANRRHDESRSLGMSGWPVDVRHALARSLREPTGTVLSLLTLAIGLGAATSLFALTNAWLLRPLPFSDAGELVSVWETIPSEDIFENTPAPAVLFDWRARSHAFSGLGALTTGTVNLTGTGEPERLNAIRADAELVRVLRLQPAIGRVFGDGDDAISEVVLTHGFWRRRFGGSREIVGSALSLDGVPATVVGVLPPGITLLGIEADVWRPLRFTAAERASLNRYLWVVGRLRPAASVAQASAEVDVIARSREPALGARAVSLQEQTVGSLGHDLPILLAATGVLLLIACANVASLTLARTAARRREFAVRAALGAGGARIAAQVVIEALPAAFLGGAAGLLLSAWLVRAFTAWLPQRDTLPPVELTDPRVFAFGFAASLASAILFALAPALQSASRRTLAGLREGGRGVAAPNAALRLLASIEVALAIALLIAASVVGRSFLRLTRIELGFEPGGVVTFELPRSSHSARDRAFFDELLRRLQQSSAVQTAGVSQALPLKSFGFGSSFPVDGAPASATHLAYWRIVSPDYFAALGIPLKTGRAFDARDRMGSSLVAIVSESYVRAAWPDGASPIGRRIGWGTLERPLTVVGVAADVRLSAATGPAPHVYMPYAQVEEFLPSQLAVRTRGSDVQAIDAVRGAARALDPLQPVANIQTMNELAWRMLARRRFQLALWAAFAVAAAILALLGVYGVVSYAVRQSSKELGIRLALGARRSAVIAHVLRQGLTLSCAGAAAGVLLAYWTAGAMRGFVVGVEPRQPLLYAAVVAVVIAASTMAAVIPARRAASVDPLDAIRGD